VSSAALGFCIVDHDELDQLFVAREARGGGVAAALIDDAEARIAAGGARVAWLACAISNLRAALRKRTSPHGRNGVPTNQTLIVGRRLAA
jgi:GNAT superfamily N-acetyltransferase